MDDARTKVDAVLPETLREKSEAHELQTDGKTDQWRAGK
jgi:hypothetical protein